MATSTGRPLTGYRILVTRARKQASAFTGQLQQLGATVVELPAIEIVTADPGPIDDALRHLASYDWLIFTSANGVLAFVERMAAIGLDASATTDVRIAAIGSATATCVQNNGMQVDFVPQRFVAEAVVEEMEALGMAGKRVLLPQAEIARDVVASGLRRLGAQVDAIVAYRTVVPSGDDSEQIRRQLRDIDIVTFASPTSVRNTLTIAGGSLPAGRVVCIGPVTAGAAEEAGLTVAAIGEEHSIAGLIEAVIRLVESNQKEDFDGVKP